jgi:hypothetical protein
MIEATGREHSASNQSKIVGDIFELRGDDLGMADGEGFVFEDVRIQ